MNNEPPARIVIGNFSDLKHKINNKWLKDKTAILITIYTGFDKINITSACKYTCYTCSYTSIIGFPSLTSLLRNAT